MRILQEMKQELAMASHRTKAQERIRRALQDMYLGPVNTYEPESTLGGRKRPSRLRSRAGEAAKPFPRGRY